MHLHGLAAAHGHRRTLRKVIEVRGQSDRKDSALGNMLSLKEALKEEKGSYA